MLGLTGLTYTILAQQGVPASFGESATEEQPVPIESLLLIDPEGEYTLPELLRADADQLFRAPEPGQQVDGRNYHCWLRLTLDGTHSAGGSHLLSVNRDADSTWVYVVDRHHRVTQTYQWFEGDNEVTSYLTFSPNTYEIFLPPGARQQIYVRAYYRLPWYESQLASAGVSRLRTRLNRKIRAIGWNSFYTGLMLCITVIGIFGYGLFRERVFLYFALVTLSFTLYFADNNLMQHLLGIERDSPDGFGWMRFTISAIVISLTLLLSRYVDLRGHFSRFYPVVIVTAIVAVAAQFVPGWLGWHVNTIIMVANLCLIAWMLSCISPIVMLGYRGDPTARRLLWATMALLLPSFVYILLLMMHDNIRVWAEVSFQLGTLGFSALLFGGVYSQVSAIRSRAKALNDQNELRSRFFTNISHEFRTPLTLIMGPLEEVIQRQPDGSEEKRLLKMAYRNAERQLGLINQVLQLSRLEARQERLELQTFDLLPELRRLLDSFSTVAEQRGISLRFTSEDSELLIQADRDKVEHIVLNLLSNALKFTPQGGTVTISVRRMKRSAVIQVIDTGEGIAPDHIDNIFDRFSRSEEGGAAGGSGIGLSLVRELVRLHGGTVYAESTVGEGTTLTFTLPVTKGLTIGTAPEPPAVTEATVDQTVAAPPDQIPAAITMDRPLILVVEDNHDLRSFIRVALGDDYRVAEAVDGVAGLAEARKLSPALIISDVMMPRKDGFALCHAIKSDLAISHIPVILLTAKSSTEARITGFGTGADDYLTKPFNHRELRARVHNLIDSRRKLRQRYAERIEVRPAEIATTPVDAEFLQRATATLEREMENESYKVADFARDLQMSSASLNRKLRALLDQSTNQFMQSVRLQRAADLLVTGSHTVAEVARLTGFRSSAYFIRAYREKYGHTPGSVLKQEEQRQHPLGGGAGA